LTVDSSSEQKDLVTDQYRTGENLNARIALHERFSTSPLDWHRWVFDHLPTEPELRVLELGCGTGRLWLTNRGRIPPGWAIILSDRSPGMCREARGRLLTVGHRYAFAVADAQAIPFADAHFDVVIANHMLYHVPDRPRAYAEIRRVLRSGGRLLAATNGTDHMRELNELARRFDPALVDAFGRIDFHLENGATELASWFANVSLDRFADGLVVPEAKPMVDYILSTTRGAGTGAGSDTRTFRDALSAFVAAELREHGSMRITKSNGVFEAWN
jgi:SAM-dependent methyltransferase